MSSFTIFTAGLALLAPLAAALDVPGGSNPTAGAVLTPDAQNPVTAGKTSDITWTVKTDGCGTKLDIVLLKGPSASQMAAQNYIAQGVDNNGKYSWAVPTSLEPSASDYGIEVICQQTQAYQYSTRFGLSNAKYSNGSSSSSTTGSGTSSSSTTAAAGNSTTTGSSASSTSSSLIPTETPKYPISNSTAPGIAAGTGSASGAAPTVTRTSTQAGSTPTGSSTTSGASSTPSTAGSAAVHVKMGLRSLAAVLAVAVAAL